MTTDDLQATLRGVVAEVRPQLEELINKEHHLEPLLKGRSGFLITERPVFDCYNEGKLIHPVILDVRVTGQWRAYVLDLYTISDMTGMPVEAMQQFHFKRYTGKDWVDVPAIIEHEGRHFIQSMRAELGTSTEGADR